MNHLGRKTRSAWKHVLTDVILIGIVEGVHDRWFCRPFVLVDRLPQFLQIVVSVVTENIQDVDQKLIFSNIQLLTNNITLLTLLLSSYRYKDNIKMSVMELRYQDVFIYGIKSGY